MDMVRYDPLYAHRVLPFVEMPHPLHRQLTGFQPLHVVLVHDAPLVQLSGLDVELPSFQLLLVAGAEL